MQCHPESYLKIKLFKVLTNIRQIDLFYVYVSAVAPLIGRYCGTKIPPEIQSSSGLLSLSFHTDMAVAKDGFSARYNMTHKEVSDCECEITFSECVFVCSNALRVGLFACFYSHLYFHSFNSFISADTRLSFFIVFSSYPLDLFCFACFNAISILKLSLGPLSLFCSLLREHDFSEADSYYFLLEYKLTSPQFTSAHLLDCFLSPFALSLSEFTFLSLSSSCIIRCLNLPLLSLVPLFCLPFSFSISSVKLRQHIHS